jgi:Flp pilus assembly protein TadB
MPTRNTAGDARKRRRLITFISSAAVVAIIVALIWNEQIALLYVLATISVTVLLVVVAMADLGSTQRTRQPAPFDDAAAAADGATPDAPRARRRG